jgi:hypothetical protein
MGASNSMRSLVLCFRVRRQREGRGGREGGERRERGKRGREEGRQEGGKE